MGTSVSPCRARPGCSAVVRGEYERGVVVVVCLSSQLVPREGCGRRTAGRCGFTVAKRDLGNFSRLERQSPRNGGSVRAARGSGAGGGGVDGGVGVGRRLGCEARGTRAAAEWGPFLLRGRGCPRATSYRQASEEQVGCPQAVPSTGMERSGEASPREGRKGAAACLRSEAPGTPRPPRVLDPVRGRGPGARDSACCASHRCQRAAIFSAPAEHSLVRH